MNQWNICLTWWRAHAQELSHFSLSYRRYFLSDSKFWNQFPLHTHSPENLLFIWHFPRHCHFLFFLSFSSYHVYPWSTFMSEEASRWKEFLTRQGIVFHQKLLCSEVFDNVISRLFESGKNNGFGKNTGLAEEFWRVSSAQWKDTL